jgi:hypothetical protein
VRLTKKQRNELFTAVTQSGINSAEFDLRINDDASSLRLAFVIPDLVNENDWLVLIAHTPSESTFKVYLVNDDGPPDFAVRRKVGIEPAALEYTLEWSNVPDSAANWASDVKYDTETPDYWAEMRAQRELLAKTSLGRLENTRFTADEQAAISAQLHEIKNYIKENASLTSEQFRQVEARIDEAEAASRRLGRKDWLLLFLGTTVPLYVTDMVPATVVQHITALVLQGLGHLFGIGGGPPPIAG